MNTRPLPPHGTRARANGRPGTNIGCCPCRPCRDADNSYKKRRMYLLATGRPLTVPAEPARAHLQQLFEHGAGWNQLTEATGLTHATMARLRSGAYRRLHRTTAEAILAIRPGDCQSPRRSVPAVGSIRRLQALAAAGHSTTRIAQESGLHVDAIKRITRGAGDTVAASTADAISKVYGSLAHTPAAGDKRGIARARNRAAAAGWPDPTWWEDYGRIDDPGFDPASVDETTIREVALGEDWEWLERQGYDREQAAQRLGVTRAYLDSSITRYRRRIARQDMETAA